MADFLIKNSRSTHAHAPVALRCRWQRKAGAGGMCGYGISGGCLEKITTGNQKYTQLTP